MSLFYPLFRILLSLLLCAVCLPAAFSQSFPADEEGLTILEELNYCSPGVVNKSRGKGVEFRYEWQGPYRFQPDTEAGSEGRESKVNSYQNWVAKIKIPLWNKPALKMMLGYEYAYDQINFDQVGDAQNALLTALDGRNLKTSKYSFYLTKSWNEKLYSVFRARMSTTGDHEGWMEFGENYRTYSAAVILGKKPSESTEWAVGLTYSSNALRTLVLPFGVYNHNFNDRWGLETVLPVHVFMRRNFDQGNILLFGARLNTRLHYLAFEDLHNTDLTPTFLRQGNIRTEVIWERHLFSWIWAYANAGLIAPIQSRFSYVDDVLPEVVMQTGIRPMFRIGIFLSPPDELMK